MDHNIKGALEGTLEGISTNPPAITIIERASKRIIHCYIPVKIEEKISNKISLCDVFQKRWITVHGLLQYAPFDEIVTVIVKDIHI